MASEVKYDLRIELSDLNYLCCHAFLASKCFWELIETGRLSSLDLRGFALGFALQSSYSVPVRLRLRSSPGTMPSSDSKFRARNRIGGESRKSARRFSIVKCWKKMRLRSALLRTSHLTEGRTDGRTYGVRLGKNNRIGRRG